MLKMIADFNMVIVSSSRSPQATTARCILSMGCTFGPYLIEKKTTFSNSFSKVNILTTRHFDHVKTEVQNFYLKGKETSNYIEYNVESIIQFYTLNQPFLANIPH